MHFDYFDVVVFVKKTADFRAQRKKQIDAKLRKVDKEIQRLEDVIGKMETELALLDDVMSHPDEHPEVKVDNDLFWSYGKKKEELQKLMDDWGERQIEREEIMAEYGS